MYGTKKYQRVNKRSKVSKTPAKKSVKRPVAKKEAPAKPERKVNPALVNMGRAWLEEGLTNRRLTTQARGVVLESG